MGRFAVRRPRPQFARRHSGRRSRVPPVHIRPGDIQPGHIRPGHVRPGRSVGHRSTRNVRSGLPLQLAARGLWIYGRATQFKDRRVGALRRAGGTPQTDADDPLPHSADGHRADAGAVPAAGRLPHAVGRGVSVHFRLVRERRRRSEKPRRRVRGAPVVAVRPGDQRHGGQEPGRRQDHARRAHARRGPPRGEPPGRVARRLVPGDDRRSDRLEVDRPQRNPGGHEVAVAHAATVRVRDAASRAHGRFARLGACRRSPLGRSRHDRHRHQRGRVLHGGFALEHHAGHRRHLRADDARLARLAARSDRSPRRERGQPAAARDGFDGDSPTGTCAGPSSCRSRWPTSSS